MKKVKMFFAAIAILTAGVAVYANNSVDPVLYRSNNGLPGVNCDVVITSQACGGGTAQCSMNFGPVIGIEYISVSNTANPATHCAIVTKQ